jgi:hypothetical protein
MTIRRHAKALHEAYMLILVNTRTAPKSDLAKTFKEFFSESDEAEELITDHQAGILLKVLELLKSTDQGDVTLSVDIAKAALESMSKFDHGRADTGMLTENPPFDDFYWILAMQLSSFIQKNDPGMEPSKVIACEVRCFSKAGHADMVSQHIKSIKDLDTWKVYVKSQFTDPSSLLDTLKTFQEFGPEADDELTSLFIQDFIHAGQSDLARRMLHGSGLLKGPGASVQPAADILKACLEDEDSPTATEIIAKVDKVLEADPENAINITGASTWFDLYTLYQTRGKSLDAVKKVILDLESRFGYTSTIDTINLLVKDAYQANNPSLAKAIIEFAKDQNMELTGYTFLPQVLHKLKHGDLDGALGTWDYVLYDLEPLKPQDMAEPMEQLLRGILSAADFRENQFDEILDNHPKYARRFRPETVVALVEFYLRREEYQNAALLMRKHAPQFTSAARRLLLSNVMRICRDESVSDECVWNIYTMIKALFDEASREIREEMMQICIKRSLMSNALEIFTDMRNHWLEKIKPTESTYLIALSGLGNSWEAIMSVHNSLKLDVHVDPSTKLWNALMRAYTRCGQDEARNAVEFWDELLDSAEGPDETSVVSVLEACSISPVGHQQAQYVWQTLEQRKIPISHRVLGAYVNNLVLTALPEETKETFESELTRNKLNQTTV